jgi:hypothetical protein
LNSNYKIGSMSHGLPTGTSGTKRNSRPAYRGLRAMRVSILALSKDNADIQTEIKSGWSRGESEYRKSRFNTLPKCRSEQNSSDIDHSI